MSQRQTTEDLIASLAAMPAPPRLRMSRIALQIVGLVGIGLVLLLIGTGLRPDLAHALTTPVTLAKNAIPLALAAIALPAAMMTARPEAEPPVWLLLLPPGWPSRCSWRRLRIRLSRRSRAGSWAIPSRPA